MFRRLKRLWELSGTLSDAEDTRMAESIKKEHHTLTRKSRLKRDQKLATILHDDPLDEFNDPEDDSASK